MQNLYKAFPLVGILLLLQLGHTSCRVHKMVVDVYQPPEVHLPEATERVAVINRMGKVEDQDIDNLVEGIFSGTGEYVNRLGAHQAVLGVIDNLDYSQEFSDVIQVGLHSGDSGRVDMPEPLAWETLDIVRGNYGSDAAVSMEYLVSGNLSFAETRRERQKSRKSGWTPNALVYDVGLEQKYIAVLKVQVETGWRIYDLANRETIEAYIQTDSIFWEVDGSTRREALRRLPNRSRAVEEAAFMAGSNYSRRILPGWKTVVRKFIVGGSKTYRGTRHKLKRRMWGDLSEIWEKGRLQEDPRAVSIALYNLALLKEMEGSLDEAEKLLNQSIETHQMSVALHYREDLKKRFEEPRNDKTQPAQ